VSHIFLKLIYLFIKTLVLYSLDRNMGVGSEIDSEIFSAQVIEMLRMKNYLKMHVKSC
jgi:hypothetical protein